MIGIRPRCLAVLAGVPVLGLLAGCTHHVSQAEVRATSFARHQADRIEGESIAEFVRKRSAILVDGVEVAAERVEPGSGEVRLQFSGRRPFGTGAAAAVDPRGYFLTAANAVSRGPHYLIAHDGMGFRILQARLVWRGDFSQGEPDLALLHVDRPLLFAFAWSDSWTPDQPIIGAGASFARPGGYTLSLVGGKVMRVSAHAHRSPPRTSFFHSAPYHYGDSGGPLVGPDGRLLAINVGILRKFLVQRLSYQTTTRAHRPDPTWLHMLIERDFAARPALRETPPRNDR